MDIRLRALSILVGVVTLFVSIAYVRKRKLNEDLALFWIILSLTMIIFAVRFNWIEWLAGFFKIKDPNNLVFFLGIVFLIFISFYFSLKISRLEKKIIVLVQENALLKKERVGKE